MSANDSNDKLYKICLVGSHGTGKTGLGPYIEAALKSNKVETNFVKEVVSDQAKMYGMPINEKTNLDTQMWILLKQFEQEVFVQAVPYHPYKVFIYDRGLDNWCYLARAMKDNPEIVNSTLQMTLTYIKLFPYSRIYLHPIAGENIEGNEIRSENKEFQLDMDKRIRTLLNEYNIKHIELPIPKKEDETHKEWTEIIVKQTLEDLGKPLIYPIR